MVNEIKILAIGLALAMSGMDRDEYARNFDKTFTLKRGQAVKVGIGKVKLSFTRIRVWT